MYTDFSQILPKEPEVAQLSADTTFCNCYRFVKEHYYPNLPSMETVIAGAAASTSDVAVFMYDVQHFAKVVEVYEDSFLIDEANYHTCKRGFREISFSDPSLVGFFDVP